MKNSFNKQEYLKNEKKNNFRWPKNQFSRVRISFLLKKVATPDFRNLNKVLNKRILFPIDWKSVFTWQNEELAKNCFRSQEYLTNGRNCFSTATKTVSTRSN